MVGPAICFDILCIFTISPCTSVIIPVFVSWPTFVPLIFNADGYERFLSLNLQLLAQFANSKSAAYREYVMSTYGDGAYRKYFEKYLDQLEEGSD